MSDMNPTALSVGRQQERVRAAHADLDVLAAEIRELTVLEDTTPEQDNALRDKIVEYEKNQEEVRRLEARYADLQQAAAIPENRSVGDASGMTGTARIKRDPYDLSELRAVAMSDGPNAVNQELRSRAHDAIEQAPEYVSDDHRQSAARLVDNMSSSRDETTGREVDWGEAFSRHMLEHGSPEYAKAFFRYLRVGIDNLNQEERAALSTSGSNGGFMIPFFLDPTIILTNAGATNPFRAIARVETIPTNVWHGVSSAGVTAEWTSEAAEMTDASPTFLQPTITPVRADAYVQASFEITQDSNIASQIGMLFADAKNRIEATAFATGTGSTQPWGLITRLAATTTSRVAAQTNASFGAVDVFALVNNLPARYQDDCSWLAHWYVYNLARQLGGPTTPNFWVDLGPGIPSQLLGRSTYLSSAMTNAGGTVGLSSATASTDNVLVLGDFSQFLIVDRIGMEIVNNPLVLGSNRRPTGEVGFAAFWRVGSDCTNADGFRLLQV